jgi:Baseplate J-like protein
VSEPFIDLGLSTNAAALRQEAIEFIEGKIENWKPSEAATIVIVIEALAQIVSAIYAAAGEVPKAIFQKFGEELLGVPYAQGSSATITLVFEAYEAAPTEGLLIPAGTYVSVGGYGFETVSTTTIEHGQTTVTVNAIAVEVGEAYNDLSTEAELVDALAYIKAVSVSTASTGGSEPEGEEGYLERLRRRLTLFTECPVTALNYANFILGADIPSGVTAGQYVSISRAVAIDGYKPGETVFEGKIESGHLSTIKEVTSFTGITVGSEILDTAGVIPPGTVVTAVNESAKEITLSASASGEHAKEKMTSVGTYKNERCVTAWVLGPDAGEVVAANREAIETYIKGGLILGTTYPERREQNFLFYCLAPEETAVSIAYQAKVLPGFDTATCEAEVLKGLERLLAPETWGTLSGYQSNIPWLNDNTVRHNKVLGVIQNVGGIDYVTELKISTNRQPVPGETDVVLAGPTPLPSRLFVQTVTGEITEGSETIKGLPSSAERQKGMYVSGIGIPAGTHIVEVKSESEVKLSAKATATNTKAFLTISSVLATLEAETYA